MVMLLCLFLSLEAEGWEDKEKNLVRIIPKIDGEERANNEFRNVKRF